MRKSLRQQRPVRFPLVSRHFCLSISEMSFISSCQDSSFYFPSLLSWDHFLNPCWIFSQCLPFGSSSLLSQSLTEWRETWMHPRHDTIVVHRFFIDHCFNNHRRWNFSTLSNISSRGSGRNRERERRETQIREKISRLERPHYFALITHQTLWSFPTLQSNLRLLWRRRGILRERWLWRIGLKRKGKEKQENKDQLPESLSHSILRRDPIFQDRNLESGNERWFGSFRIGANREGGNKLGGVNMEAASLARWESMSMTLDS